MLCYLLCLCQRNTFASLVELKRTRPPPVDVHANCSETHYSNTATFETSRNNLMLIYCLSGTIYKELLHIEEETEALQHSCGD